MQWYIWARLIKGMDEKNLQEHRNAIWPLQGARGGGVVAPTESKGALTQAGGGGMGQQ